MYKNCLYNIQGDFICNVKEHFDNNSIFQENIIKKYNVMMETQKNYNNQYNKYLITQEKFNSIDKSDKSYNQYLQTLKDQNTLQDDYKKLNNILLKEYNNANSQYYNHIINRDKTNKKILQEQIAQNVNNDIKHNLFNILTMSEERYNKALNESYKYK